MTVENPRIKTNLIFALFAQAVSLTAGLLMALLIPKVLGVEQYGYWQLFLLYASYVGLASLGIADGLYLRIGGRKYESLSFPDLHAQYRVFFTVQTLALGFALALVTLMSGDKDRLFISFSVVAFGILANAFSWLSYVMQGTNLTHLYSIAVLGNKAFFVALFLIAYVWGPDKFQVFVFLYVACQLIAVSYLTVCAREIFRSSTGPTKSAFVAVRGDLRAGIKLMIAYHVAALILGFSRLLVDANWGIFDFSYYSFALSITAFFLTFLGQLSLVLFPVLKRLGQADLRKSLLQIRDFLYSMLPIAYLAYVPLTLFLGWWLPEYRPSLTYLGLVMPVAVFDSKTNMLGTTFMKVLRKEQPLLLINLASLVFSASITLVAVYVFGNLTVVCVAAVLSVIFRALLCEIYISRQIHYRFFGTFLLEAALATAFMAAVLLNGITGWIIFYISSVCYLFARISSVKSTWRLLIGQLRG